MKKVILIFLNFGFFFVSNAQINNKETTGNTGNGNFAGIIKIDTCDVCRNPSAEKKVPNKRKCFFKKMCSYYEGIDIRNAWIMLSRN